MRHLVELFACRKKETLQNVGGNGVPDNTYGQSRDTGGVYRKGNIA